jgi:hypothetical protein
MQVIAASSREQSSPSGCICHYIITYIGLSSSSLLRIGKDNKLLLLLDETDAAGRTTFVQQTLTSIIL